MKDTKHTKWLMLVIGVALLCICIYYNFESKIYITKYNIVTQELSVAFSYPYLSSYESTDDIKLEFYEYPNNTFSINYKRISPKDAKKVLKILETKVDTPLVFRQPIKVLVDFEEKKFRWLTKKNFFLNKISVPVLGLRKTTEEDIPYLLYTIEKMAAQKAISLLALVGGLLLIVVFIIMYYKGKKSNKIT